MKHCCQSMRDQVLEDHSATEASPEVELSTQPKVLYLDRFDEYGITVLDNGSSFLEIHYCPWCGTKLPDSKRQRWFKELQGLGVSDLTRDEIPQAYLSDAWFKDEIQTTSD